MAAPSNAFSARAPSLGRVPPGVLADILRNTFEWIRDMYGHLAATITMNVTIEDWIAPTLLNSWVDFGSSYSAAGYCKGEDGVVRLKGNVKSGSGIPTTVFALPAGYRPSEILRFAVDSNGAFGAVSIDTSGNVQAAVGSTTRLSLDGISFRV